MKPAAKTLGFFLLALCAPVLAFAQGFPPEQAVSRMTPAEGLKARLVASEPLVRQPVAIEFDDRGRLWVIQYLQYPNPEGLKRVAVDRFSRTRYDHLPEPPPKGPKGADRITILEDADGDGRMDRAHDFVSGLNLATGLAFGYGGVFVINAPYLLFYPDRDRDDVPDGDPEVLVAGFGIEDAHSVANSLTWGPDGWLYGLQGSTVTAKINGIEFQQGVWRYHPLTKRFELFAEGGGNMWGLDFDRQGNLIASTNVGGNVMLHFVQGGNYWKQFGKHGALHNPYAFGYFDHVKHEAIQGGHVSVGGLFYYADAWPERYQGRYLAGDLLGHAAHWHEVRPLGSTFQARQLGDLLRANDVWFAPDDLTIGPEGSVYIADWFDKRTAHPDPDADWDRTNGRIFALDGPRWRPGPFGFDLQAYSTRELIEHLRHPNIGYGRRARRILAERHDPAAIAPLRAAVSTWEGAARLEALWALHGCGGFDEKSALELLNDRDEAVRAWAVRLMGDQERDFAALAAPLLARAREEPSVSVRAQLASSAQRFPPRLGIEIAHAIAQRDLDADDPHVPLLLWWAIERHVKADPMAIFERFIAGDPIKSGLIRAVIQPRLVKRFAADQTDQGDMFCATLIASAADEDQRRALLVALDESLRGRRVGRVGPPLARAIEHVREAAPDDPTLLRLAARCRDDEALDEARKRASDRAMPESTRLAMLDLLGELGKASSVDPLLDLAIGDDPTAVQAAALRALSHFDETRVAERILAAYPAKPAAWRSSARDLLLGRAAWAKAFLDAIDAGRLEAKDVPLEQVGRVALWNDPTLDELVRKHWGRLAGPTPEEKLAEVRRLNNDLRAAAGDPQRGRELFVKNCAACHRLFGEGNLVGPELTFANRKDRDFLLVSLVDPNRVIRKEFQASVIHTHDGRVLNGLITEQSPEQLTLVSPSGERSTLPRAQVEAMTDSPTSLMPEDLYRKFDPEHLRDLFSYLQSEHP